MRVGRKHIQFQNLGFFYNNGASFDGGTYGPLYSDSGVGFSRGSYTAIKKAYIGATISYGDTFVNVPDPTITVTGSKVITSPPVTVYEKTTSGCKVKFLMRKIIKRTNGETLINGWAVLPGEITFNWSVTGNKTQTVSASDSNSETTQ